jgi:hypothetical protein
MDLMDCCFDNEIVKKKYSDHCLQNCLQDATVQRKIQTPDQDTRNYMFKVDHEHQ